MPERLYRLYARERALYPGLGGSFDIVAVSEREAAAEARSRHSMATGFPPGQIEVGLRPSHAPNPGPVPTRES